MTPWRPADIGDQSGTTVVVTGTSVGGLGFHTSKALAAAGARVIMANRQQRDHEAADRAIRAEHPQADLDQVILDLADFSSVRDAAALISDRFGPIDALINNAGVMAPQRTRSVDGLEIQLATNHYGPFLLTGLLMEPLLSGGAGRVVTVSSHFHRFTRKAPLHDPRSDRGRYSPWVAYGESKLANLLFTQELDRRARDAGLPLRALAAHPGFAGTHLAANGQYGRSTGGRASVLDAAIRAVSQSAEAGSWPSLMAATADLPGGTFVGPSGLAEFSGLPQITRGNELAHDPTAARELWALSEQVTGLTYP